jgi:hypothetical protein
MGMIGTILTVIGSIGAFVFGIQLLILAFKTSVGWGIASLLIPFAIFVYAAKNWGACKTPMLRWVACLVLMGVGFGLSFAGAMSNAMSGAGTPPTP